jgi:hypothetical protein
MTCKMGSGLDYCIYWHLIHRTWNYRQLQRCHWSTHFTVHGRTRVLSLPASGFITISLSLQITHGVFFSQSNSSLAIILQLPILKTLHNSIPLLPSSYPGRLASRNLTFHFLTTTLLHFPCCRTILYNHFAQTPQKTLSSTVKEAYLLIHCLAMDVLFLCRLARAGMCFPSGCLAIYIHVTVLNKSSILEYLSISVYSCCSHLEHRASLKRFVSFQFLNLRQSVGLLGRGIIPTQGLYLHRTTQTQNKRRQISMPWVGFKPMIPVLKRPKTFHALDRAATVIGLYQTSVRKITACTVLQYISHL